MYLHVVPREWPLVAISGAAKDDFLRFGENGRGCGIFQVRSFTYFGELNQENQPHGKGIHIYDTGNISIRCW